MSSVCGPSEPGSGPAPPDDPPVSWSTCCTAGLPPVSGQRLPLILFREPLPHIMDRRYAHFQKASNVLVPIFPVRRAMPSILFFSTRIRKLCWSIGGFSQAEQDRRECGILQHAANTSSHRPKRCSRYLVRRKSGGRQAGFTDYRCNDTETPFHSYSSE